MYVNFGRAVLRMQLDALRGLSKTAEPVMTEKGNFVL